VIGGANRSTAYEAPEFTGDAGPAGFPSLKTRYAASPSHKLARVHGGERMRIDKLTTKFQEALGDAQSIAAGHDNPYIEPQHSVRQIRK
jgi:hypothetical protein